MRLQDDVVAASLRNITDVHDIPCQCCVAFFALELVADAVVRAHTASAAKITEPLPRPYCRFSGRLEMILKNIVLRLNGRSDARVVLVPWQIKKSVLPFFILLIPSRRQYPGRRLLC